MANGVQFTNNFATVKGRIKQGAERHVRQATAYLEGEIKSAIMDNSPSGRIYPVPGTSKVHQASAPGETPAVMFGNYVNSISHDVRTSVDEIIGTTGTNQAQGKRLEFGFVGVDSMGRRYNQAPRPHFKPTYERSKQKIIEMLSRGIE